MKSYKVRKALNEAEKEQLKSYPEFLQHLLHHRGLRSEEAAEEFLFPQYEKGVHDPYLMKDMEKAVTRIIEAIEKGEKTVIFSDFDADGIPGAVILHDFFKKIGYENFENYIPDRHNEGYGLNLEAIQKFKDLNASLLITIDCGISNFKEIEKANELGIDVIITDHHLPHKKLPPAFAILNSKQEDCSYPFKMLCGAGVVFKLIQAILKKSRYSIKEGMEKWYLDMVGFATLSDMVPLQGENRIFAHYGLMVLRKSPRPGLLELFRRTDINPRFLSEDDISFSLTPKINAASRMGSPIEAFELLHTSDVVRARELSESLIKLNDERKGVVAGMIREMKKAIENRADQIGEVIVLGNPKWRPSLLGLCANNLADEFQKPVFLWGREGSGLLKGSGRSNGLIDLSVLMNEASSEIILEYGGHAYAGGFSVAPDKIHLLEVELNKAYLKAKVEAVLTEDFVDKKISIDEVNWDIYKLIEKLAPYGEGNPKPVFLLENLEINEVKNFGKTNNHLELSFLNQLGKRVKAIGFFMSEQFSHKSLAAGDKINLVATFEKSNFRNYPELRLRIVDII
ncbi:MAG TPA: single-stranded-DNA-specific exonuclease RecJ [Candidatus Paceibacterota bacterium]|nr:single-stranded-DNA-specific exonuclease RecJ [Candidatus Paceibacterota bacterium]